VRDLEVISSSSLRRRKPSWVDRHDIISCFVVRILLLSLCPPIIFIIIIFTRTRSRNRDWLARICTYHPSCLEPSLYRDPAHSMPSTISNLLFLIAFISLLPLQVSAFGAGDIPDFSYLHDKAFRHGDIENILAEVAKTVGGLATGSGMLRIAQSIMAVGSSGSKFDKGDIKKVYFGNWLRDHSQALDIGGLSKLSSDTLVLIVAVLSFMVRTFIHLLMDAHGDREQSGFRLRDRGI